MKQSEPKKHGKEYAEWRRVRAAWIRANPPSHEGHYLCGICGKTVSADGMELDHIDPRSGDPASRYDFTNLQPSHGTCNQWKGSRRVQPKVTPAEYRLRRILDL